MNVFFRHFMSLSLSAAAVSACGGTRVAGSAPRLTPQDQTPHSSSDATGAKPTPNDSNTTTNENNNTASDTTTDPAPQPEPVPAPTDKTPSVDPAEQEVFNKTVLPIFTAKCSECHHSGKDLVLDHYPWSWTRSKDRAALAATIVAMAGGAHASMPPAPRDPLTAEELQIVRAWGQ